MTTFSAGQLALVTHLAKSGEAVKSGPIGLAVILLLCIACYFLFKSMSKHLRRVRETPPTTPPTTPMTTSQPRPASKPAGDEIDGAVANERRAEPPTQTAG